MPLDSVLERPLRFVSARDVLPVLTAVAGYFPGGRIGAVGDLPAGVIRQWRRWCLSPDYFASAEGASAREQFDAVRTPIVSLSFTPRQCMQK